MAQDPTKVDSTHYSLVFENDQVRVLRITYGSYEKSVMHEHPDRGVIFLNDAQTQFTLPDGTTVEAGGKLEKSFGLLPGNTFQKTSPKSLLRS